MFGGQAIVCGLLAAEWGASNRPILALKSDAQPSLDSAQRESVLGHYHTESFTRLAHPGCPSNSRRDQGAMLFTKRWTNRRRDAGAHLDVGLASSIGLDLEFVVNAIINLEAEYRLTRAALVNAGLDMTNSIDALYRDWRRWRDKSKSLAAVDRVGVADPDQWWARHLAQFRSLIERRVNNDSAFRFSIDKDRTRTKERPGERGPI
jgi:predicted NUDIX family NTP pyrophosphohydrolase